MITFKFRVFLLCDYKLESRSCLVLIIEKLKIGKSLLKSHLYHLSKKGIFIRFDNDSVSAGVLSVLDVVDHITVLTHQPCPYVHPISFTFSVFRLRRRPKGMALVRVNALYY